MGVVVGTWHFGETYGELPTDQSAAISTIARRLAAATRLRVELRIAIEGSIEPRHEDYTLRVPTLREGLFDWFFNDREITVHGFIPGHPYVWENLDAVMTSAGGRRDTAVHSWQPNSAHARLRRRFDTLLPQDRVLLRIPSIMGARPLDRLL